MNLINLLVENETSNVMDGANLNLGKKADSEKTGSAKEQETVENGATVSISEEARAKYQEALNALTYLEQMREQEKESEGKQDEYGKIMTIFRRISRGDIVPLSDERKLLEYSSEMYQMAKSAAMMADNDDPKKHKSVDADEKRKNLLMPEDLEKQDSVGVSGGLENVVTGSGSVGESVEVANVEGAGIV